MMKRIINLLVFTTFSLFTFAQHESIVSIENSANYQNRARETVYFKDINNIYDKFIGQWRYADPNNSNTYLEITIIENPYKKLIGDYYDEIYLEFKYVENGQVIYNSDNYTQEQLKHKISGSAMNSNECSLFYREPTDLPVIFKNTREHAHPTLYLEYQELLSMPTGGITEQLHWEVKFVIGENEVWPFKIPNDIVLTRI